MRTVVRECVWMSVLCYVMKLAYST